MNARSTSLALALTLAIGLPATAQGQSILKQPFGGQRHIIRHVGRGCAGALAIDKTE